MLISNFSLYIWGRGRVISGRPTEPWWSWPAWSSALCLYFCWLISSIKNKCLNQTHYRFKREFKYKTDPLGLQVLNLCQNINWNKVGCIFPMVVVSILPQVEFGPNDHREDTPLFIKIKFWLTWMDVPGFGLIWRGDFRGDWNLLWFRIIAGDLFLLLTGEVLSTC